MSIDTYQCCSGRQKNHLCSFIAFVLGSLSFIVISEHVIAQQDVSESLFIEEVVTLGTRSSEGRTVTDLPVAVDVVDSETLRQTGLTEVGRMLQSSVPSFNFSSSSISDGTDALRPATLRGLGPDQTLVLVNGKRRHNSALIHVNTSVGRGTAGVDMNAIPASSIKRIEVLRDGAAAQYGSDAIAGVINIVLKDDDTAGRAAASYGETTEGDGETEVFSLNKGFEWGDGGFLNLTYEYRDRGRTNRAGLDGTQQYAADPVTGQFDQREFNFDRTSFRIGDSDSEQNSLVGNAAMPLGEEGLIYGNVTYSRRDNTSGGFYRTANDSRNPVSSLTGQPQYPNGFLPLINTDIDDFSLALGYERTLNEWDLDISVQRGVNRFQFDISNSLNASHVEAFGSSPTAADAGELELQLTVFNIDVVKDFDDFTLALGAEFKEDHYKISAGEPLSYLDYDPLPPAAAGTAPAGIQVFPGFRPENTVDEERDAKSIYGDIEMNLTSSLLLGAALRYEDYSDFGDTLNGKLAIRWDITDSLRLRSSFSTGFRAPSMQQLFFNNVSTQFTGPGGLPEERGTFRNDSAVAQALGIPQLQEEESTNFAVGFVITPVEHLTITADYYRIQIDDRIVISGAIEQGLSAALDAVLVNAGADSAQFFLNAADTETDGVDIVATYNIETEQGQWRLSAAANFTETDIESIRAPSMLAADPTVQARVFTEQDQSILEEWQPEDRINLTASYLQDRFGFTVSFNRYGEYTVRDSCASGGNNCRSQTFDAEWLTDLQFTYEMKEHLTLEVGGNNIFDVTPERNEIGQSRASPAGGLIDPVTGGVAANSPGVFVFSRRSAPFGFNGAYFYAGISYEF